MDDATQQLSVKDNIVNIVHFHRAHGRVLRCECLNALEHAIAMLPQDEQGPFQSIYDRLCYSAPRRIPWH